MVIIIISNLKPFYNMQIICIINNYLEYNCLLRIIIIC